MENRDYFLGVDVGSTTVKSILLDSSTLEPLYHSYVRHNAEQPAVALKILKEIHEKFPDARIRPVFCGSGSQEIARILGAFYIQEVVATGMMVKRYFPDIQSAIELGGQDAKIIFFKKDSGTGTTFVSDMRMNGSCAGGTGAFIDQLAELLNITPEEFGGFADRAQNLYEISGRCGVFAKTDIQPLLNQGAAREDLALSTFHAIVKQTIGGLAQGMKIDGPAMFLGGPLTFNPGLVRVFAEKLGLSPNEIVVPDHPELFIAKGAALSLPQMFQDKECGYSEHKLVALKQYIHRSHAGDAAKEELFFKSPQEKSEFLSATALKPFLPAYKRPEFENTKKLEVYLGIDAGSTTSKFVLLDRDSQMVDYFYGSNKGEPLNIVRDGLLAMRDTYREKGIELSVIGSGSTGYGEEMFYEAFLLDNHSVETLSHTRGALEFCPDVSFILDIGGQDMKAIYVKNGEPVHFELNEACSAGCGSFLETYASSLNIKIEDVAEVAFQSDAPSRLGSRCTVFMNSSIITEQKNGRSRSDIMAGLCYSIVENALTKVLRIHDYKKLGNNIVVQGGTFKNDAVLRAFQNKIGKKLIRPPFPGMMGAIGAALIIKEKMEQESAVSPTATGFSWEWIENFTCEKLPSSVCEYCSNSCKRNILLFSGAKQYVTGHRCEKGRVLDSSNDPEAKKKLREISKKIRKIPDLFSFREKLIQKDFEYEQVEAERGETIGIPLILEFWNSLPFWKPLFQSLGFRVVVSSPTTAQMFESGLSSVSSDTVCLPAKIAHGHILDLIKQNPDRIFNPMMMKLIKENKNSISSWTCPVLQGYSEVVRIHDDPTGIHGIEYDAPAFMWDSTFLRNRQICDFMKEKFGISKRSVIRAIEQGDYSQIKFQNRLRVEGKKALDSIETEDGFAVILAGRPYHNDRYINHELALHFTGLGIPVLDIDSLPGLERVDIGDLLIETNNNFHTRLLAAGLMAAKHPRLELVQIVSFGCGHDAILSDELVRIMNISGKKSPLILKLDESENTGPIGIRVRSFVETIRNRRKKGHKKESNISVSCR